MSPVGGWRNFFGRAGHWLRVLVLVGLFGFAGMSVATFATVEHTAKPEFCRSCHIMEPYYQSWESSSHAEVGCIECHYEPGVLETVEGKFKALSQLAKYVTRTQGTKPWAEVSDASCMRSGCHSVRMLEGRIKFGEVAFDHRHHLLESRRGRRLQCVSCHSQIVQGEHTAVTASVCYMCHFMPGADGKRPEQLGDCLMCHGPPEHPVEVGGRAFHHDEYVARGVVCQECHNPVVRGRGRVRRERCHSCHGEVGHIERIGEIEFLHEAHVTNHKVECFECHDEIDHGRLVHDPLGPAASEGCGTCHGEAHSVAGRMYAGTGALGVADLPSRMFETSVVCEACHTGRSNGRIDDGGFHSDAHAAHMSSGKGPVQAAGNVDCIHCHGTGFNGMLAGWQAAVGGQLERLRPLLTELEAELPEAEDDPVRALWSEARHNLDFVSADGSRGVHNPDYALDALRAGAERIDAARALLAPGAEPLAAVGFPHRSEHGCSACHLGIESAPAVGVNGLAFSHDSHVQVAGLDCDACHSVETHGAPSFPRTDCASCHHAESDERDVWDCASCHDVQAGMLAGSVAGFEGHEVMGELECTECHGDPPEFMQPSPAMCVLCHEDGYDAMHEDWQRTVGEQLERLDALRTELMARLPGADAEARALVDAAAAELAVVRRDGSQGVHNVHLALDLLRAAAEKLDGAAALLEPGSEPHAADGFPFRSEHGCSVCHVTAGLEAPASRLEEAFPHSTHVTTAALDCDACHSTEEHGQPAAERADCASCHHAESDERDVRDCASCHDAQADFLYGELPGFEEIPGAKSDFDCNQCHGDPPDVGPPNETVCNMCHDVDTLSEEQVDFTDATADLAERLRAALAAARESGDADPAAIEAAQAALDLFTRDRSGGVHNSEFALYLLEEALDRLGE